MINYITNLNVNEHSGGWSGMNHSVYYQLKKRAEVNLIQNINPDYDLWHKVSSKAMRVLGLEGVFPAFAEERLDRIRKQVEPALHPEADLNFFHGVTPWLHIQSKKPYALYLDACFATYIEIYHPSQNFRKAQLDELYRKESNFLNKAYAVFFSSQWALNETRVKYKIDGHNFHVAGLGGGFDASEQTNTPGKYFLFVGLDFVGKGGDQVIDAFNKISNEHQDFKLKIIGGRPSEALLKNTNIEYIGFIDKTTEHGYRQLCSLFASAYCFVLPTTKDLTPLVLVEAGSVGCPVISMRSFGIPEIVKEDNTGVLLDPKKNIAEQLKVTMNQLCADSKARDRMSENSIRHIRENFTWDRTGNIIGKVLAGAYKKMTNA